MIGEIGLMGLTSSLTIKGNSQENVGCAKVFLEQNTTVRRIDAYVVSMPWFV